MPSVAAHVIEAQLVSHIDGSRGVNTAAVECSGGVFPCTPWDDVLVRCGPVELVGGRSISQLAVHSVEVFRGAVSLVEH